jgi:hypothetical protein
VRPTSKSLVNKTPDPTNVWAARPAEEVDFILPGNPAALRHSGTGTYLYVGNTETGAVDVFDHNRQQISSFTDHLLPRGYAPVDLRLIDARLFVTFIDWVAFRHRGFAELDQGVIASFNEEGILLERAEFCSRRRLDLKPRPETGERTDLAVAWRRKFRRISRRPRSPQ